MANEGGGSRKSAGSDQDIFYSQDQTVSRLVIEGYDDKAKSASQAIPPRPTDRYWQLHGWLRKSGSENKQLKNGLPTGTSRSLVLTMPVRQDVGQQFMMIVKWVKLNLLVSTKETYLKL